MRQPPWMQALHQQIADAGPALIIASSTTRLWQWLRAVKPPVIVIGSQLWEQKEQGVLAPLILRPASFIRSLREKDSLPGAVIVLQDQLNGSGPSFIPWQDGSRELMLSAIDFLLFQRFRPPVFRICAAHPGRLTLQAIDMTLPAFQPDRFPVYADTVYPAFMDEISIPLPDWEAEHTFACKNPAQLQILLSDEMRLLECVLRESLLQQDDALHRSLLQALQLRQTGIMQRTSATNGT